jgi:glycosyltransferase involved in cell wall biosynthesis
MPGVLLDGRMAAGGVGRYRDELVAALQFVAPQLHVTVLERKTTGRLGRDAPFTPWGRAVVARLARRAGVDLLHSLHLELPETNAPSLVTIHDVIPLEFPPSMHSPLARSYFRRLLMRSVTRGHKIIAPSELTASDLVRHGAPHDKIEVIPIGVGKPFEPVDESARDRARSRFARGRAYVGSVAEARAHKNRRVLAAVADLLPDTAFVCRGSPLPRAPDNLWFVERMLIKDLALFYAGAELLVMTSVIEGYGLPVLEAAACGTPVVAGPRVGVVPFLGEGVSVADPDEPVAIAQRVAAISGDAPLRRDLSRAARAAASKLTALAMATSTAELYARMPGLV